MKKQMIIAAIAALAMAVLGTLYEQATGCMFCPTRG